MPAEFFEQMHDGLRGAIPDQLGPFEVRWHGYGLKLWFPDEPKEHYEAQLVRGKTKGVPALEVGFHAEHPNAKRNDELLDVLRAKEKTWRRALGKEPELAGFLHAPDRPWRRFSEVWDGVDPEDPSEAHEAAARLVEYVTVVEPLRRKQP